ncbi:ankyrin [Delitschia confertaspora ATCC 74209]|uniref:Ankyrin n=1 Tax=Delitschia confertaspora ATCC 74209 TaxID=1513339 RepID=A0A9P4JQN2_9PLEO|nr:ankyrin [Delitschia confertaspora ATCC 74209]
MAHPQLSEDAIDDILYLSRANEVSELFSYLSDLSQQTGLSNADLVAAAKDPYSQNTALHYAAANGHLEILKALLADKDTAAKSAINALNDSGNTPLHWAALNGHLECVKFLVERGADVTVINKAGHDAVFEAEINDKKDVVDWLLGAVEELEKGIAGGKVGEASGSGSSDEVGDMTIRMGKMDTEDGNAHG